MSDRQTDRQTKTYRISRSPLAVIVFTLASFLQLFFQTEVTPTSKGSVGVPTEVSLTVQDTEFIFSCKGEKKLKWHNERRVLTQWLTQWREGAGSMEGGCWLSGGKVLTQWREGTDSVASQSFGRQNIPHLEVLCQAFVINLPLNNWPLVISSFLLKTHRNNRVLPKMDENNVVWRHGKPSVPETSDWELQAPGERFHFWIQAICWYCSQERTQVHCW